MNSIEDVDGMNKCERLKSVIKRMIDTNPLVVKSINCINERLNDRLAIEICCDADCQAWTNLNIIYLGLGCISRIYQLLNSLTDWDFNKYMINIQSNQNDEYGVDRYLKLNKDVVILPRLGEELDVLKEINKLKFLENTSLTISDMICLGAMGFLLFHELGHLIHDPKISGTNMFTKEIMADIFANEALNVTVIHSEYKQSSCVAFVGAIMAISQILMHRDQLKELKDVEHPHTIERMYGLFRFWNVSDESPIWELAYSIIQKWTNKYSIDITWLKDSSTSYKEKVNDAYEHFRKK